MKSSPSESGLGATAPQAHSQSQTWAVTFVEPIQHELEDNFGLERTRPATSLTPAGISRHSSYTNSCGSLLQIATWLLALLTLTAVAFVLCREYLTTILTTIDHLPGWSGPVLFLAAYILVAFPFMVGVVVLNLAGGYLYGLWYGILLCVFGGSIGAIIATWACRHCFKGIVTRLQDQYSNLKQISRVLEGDQGFRIVCMARLTFVPFGLQNALFSSAKFSRRAYFLATAAGLFPMTALNVYIGTTVRSMEDVMSGDWQNNAHYVVVVAGQLIIACIVTLYVSQRMKREVLAACREGAASKRVPNPNMLLNTVKTSGLLNPPPYEMSPRDKASSPRPSGASPSPLPALPVMGSSIARGITRGHKRSFSEGHAVLGSRGDHLV